MKHLRRRVACSFFVAAALAAPAAADTTVTGGTVINQTWTLAGSPYLVQGDITVPAGSFLTIEAGVIVQASSNSDSQAAGLSTSRVEITIDGSLTVNGTALDPVTFRSSGTTSGSWYGIIVSAGAVQARITGAVIQDATYGIMSYAAGTVLDLDATTVTESQSYGLYVRAGSPVVDALDAINNSTAGVFVGDTGSITLTGSVFRGNGSAGIYFQPTSSRTLTVTNTTFYANGSYGVYTGAASPGTVTISDSIITSHSSYGVYRSDASAITTTYSNVWSNSTSNFGGGASAGTGVIAANPLYVSAPTNLRITENSPSRFGGNGGDDMGALPYVSDPTPGLYGTLWTNRTLAAGTYLASGDLTVALGVTLTLDPGTSLAFVSNSDVMAAGASTSRGELIVLGSLIADGTAAAPITVSSSGTTSGSWYGIDLTPSATGCVLDHLTVQDATYGIQYRTTGAGNSLDHLTLTESQSYGLYVRAGNPVVDALSAINNSTAGVFVGDTGSITLTGSIFRGNGSAGIYFQPTSSRTLTVTNTTFYANGSYGVYTGAASPGTVTISDSIITNHSSYGVYRSDASAITTTYSNVWSNSTSNFGGGASAGTGVIAANPLYVSAPTNLRLTENSPSRFGGNGGDDMGALPYVSDPTPGLYGTLWTNRTLAAGSHLASGDLTVALGVTLTLAPGTSLAFVGNSDVMAAGASTSRSELIVLGSLVADGTAAAPITVSSSGTTSGSWYGIDLTPSATGCVLDHVSVQDATYGIQYRTTGAGNVLGHLTLTESQSYGLYVRAGSPVIDALTAINNSTAGVFVGDNGSVTLTNAVFRGNGSAGIYFQPTSSRTLTVTNSTLYANGSYGVYSGAASPGTVTITNSIITNHSSYGVYRSDASAITTTYSDVWSNSTSNFGGGASAGTGVISQNPNYVSVPTDLRLQGTSVCIDAGTTGPTTDANGVTRPLDGNGLGGVQWDMGAYEFVLVATCGNGAVEPGEMCDSGASNGMYGHCNALCTALGPRCGDSAMNGVEQCDDGNASNTDACTTTCRTATCGDSYIRAGVELCDDGNLSNTDGCVGACVLATCGDSYVRAGIEVCDDGNMIDTDMCRNTCEPSACGDGVVQAGEECDDNNGVDTDACRSSCMTARCGDGVIRAGVEQCDDGNTMTTDACTASCQTAACGDGITQAGVEECDDANTVDTDVCVGVCVAARCGDGFVRTGVEGCDDGNLFNDDTCTNACVSSTCGDGVVQAGVETCDDANQVDTDACRNNCAQAICGDSVIHGGVEACDDGNIAASDGCGATCQTEAGPASDAGVDAGGGGTPVGSGGCCSSSGAARDSSVLGALAILLTLRRRRRRAISG